MARTAVLSYTPPTPSATQAPIAYVDIQFSADNGANFTSLKHAAPTETSFTQTELDPGDYIFRLIVIDTQTPAKSSSPVDAPFNVPVPVLDAPSPVINVSVSLV